MNKSEVPDETQAHSRQIPSLILFDCDGTLMDSHIAIVRAMQKAFCQCGLPEPSEKAVFDVIGLSLGRAIDQLAGSTNRTEEIKQAYRDYYRAAEPELKLYPGVRETLLSLQQRGYWLGVVTGKSTAGLLRVLDTFDLQDYFYVLRTADCCNSKPHPAMVLECMAEMGVGAAQTCVVGDALFDIQMAQSAGVAALGVSFGVSGSDELERAGAMAVVNDFSDLLVHFPPLHDHQLSPTMVTVL
jgi:phosphoglycolate phosphatase